MKNTSFKNESHQDWMTPQWLFQRLHKAYKFDVDGAASYENHLLPDYICLGVGEESDLFDYVNNDWERPVTFFVNPPWNELNKDQWWERFSQQKSIMLVPFTPETKMWHKYVWPNASVFIFNKRINYVHPITGIETKGIARPSALICFNLPTIEMSDLGVWVRAVVNV